MNTIFLSTKVDQLMSEKNLTLAQLSVMSGLSISMLSLIRRGERCKRPSYNTLQKLSAALSVPVEHFYNQN